MLTITLIMIIIVLFKCFSDSCDAAEARRKRNKIEHLDTTDLSLQKEIYLKWFDRISEEIEKDGINDNRPSYMVGIIGRKYAHYNIPCWDASDNPDYQTRVNGNVLRGKAFKEDIDDDTRPTIGCNEMLEVIKDRYCPYWRSKYGLGTTPAEDWRLWLAHERWHCTYEDWCKKDEITIRYILFKDKIDDLYNKLIEAGVLKIEPHRFIDEDRSHKRLLIYCKSYSECGFDPLIIRYNKKYAPDDGSKECIAWHAILDNVQETKCTRMETILMNDTLRAYFINLICLLTKKELAERGYSYSPGWNGLTGLKLYEPTDEEAKEYPWLFM